MKKYIFSMVALFLASFSLTSCLDEYKDNPVNFPAEGVAKTGVWRSATLDNNKYDYTAVRTQTSDGKDLFYIVREGKPGTDAEGEVRTVFVNKPDSVESLPKVGMFEAFSKTTYFSDGQNGTEAIGGEAYLAYRNNLKDFTLQLVSDDEILFTEQVAPADGYVPTLAGYWEGINENGKYIYIWFDGKVAVLGDENNDPEYVGISYDPETGVYTVAGEDSEIVVTLAFNGNKQLEATVDGETFIVDPVSASDSEPEGFEAKYTATFTSTLFGYSDPEVIIYEGDKGVGNYAFGPFIDADAFFFNWAEDNTLSFDPQVTGYVHVQNGQTFGMVYAFDSYANQQCDDPSYYDPDAKTYHFYCLYYIPGVGGFGTFEETLKITGYAEEATVAKIRFKAHRNGKVFRKPVAAPFDPSRFNFK